MQIQVMIRNHLRKKMDTKTSIGNFPKNTSFYIASYMLSIRSGFKLDMKKVNISYL